MNTTPRPTELPATPGSVIVDPRSYYEAYAHIKLSVLELKPHGAKRPIMIIGNKPLPLYVDGQYRAPEMLWQRGSDIPDTCNGVRWENLLAYYHRNERDKDGLFCFLRAFFEVDTGVIWAWTPTYADSQNVQADPLHGRRETQPEKQDAES